MAARALTNEEYAKLAGKLGATALDAPNQLKQVHRLLCEGREVESLTPAEQFYAGALDGATFAVIPNDYGWDPGIEVTEAKAETKESKPKKENNK